MVRFLLSLTQGQNKLESLYLGDFSGWSQICLQR